jgi:hypothetical protein
MAGFPLPVIWLHQGLGNMMYWMIKQKEKLPSMSGVLKFDYNGRGDHATIWS